MIQSKRCSGMKVKVRYLHTRLLRLEASNKQTLFIYDWWIEEGPLHMSRSLCEARAMHHVRTCDASEFYLHAG